MDWIEMNIQHHSGNYLVSLGYRGNNVAFELVRGRPILVTGDEEAYCGLVEAIVPYLGRTLSTVQKPKTTRLNPSLFLQSRSSWVHLHIKTFHENYLVTLGYKGNNIAFEVVKGRTIVVTGEREAYCGLLEAIALHLDRTPADSRKRRFLDADRRQSHKEESSKND